MEVPDTVILTITLEQFQVTRNFGPIYLRVLWQVSRSRGAAGAWQQQLIANLDASKRLVRGAGASFPSSPSVSLPLRPSVCSPSGLLRNPPLSLFWHFAQQLTPGPPTHSTKNTPDLPPVSSCSSFFSPV
ncbi:hypothetical protein MCOR25_001219 [Pyricularia grisea]|nr:hypothetical protein MCOR25_001219 [Pyricularia grisea]